MWHGRFCYFCHARTHTLTEFHSPLWCWTSSSSLRGSHSEPVSPKGLAKMQPTCFLRAVPTCTSTTLLLPAAPLSLLSVFLLASRQSRNFMAQTAPCSGVRHHLNYWNSQWEKVSTRRKDQQDELWILQYFICNSWNLTHDPNCQPPMLRSLLLITETWTHVTPKTSAERSPTDRSSQDSTFLHQISHAASFMWNALPLFIKLLSKFAF